MEDFEWNVANEGQLLDAMVGHKPVGINKYFQMACICEKFAENSQKDIESDKIWEHLRTMYNLEVLDENEAIPFPNAEKDFSLPDSEFGSLLAKKDEEKKTTVKGRETPNKSIKELKKDEKATNSAKKETPRRDSKDSKDKAPASARKEVQDNTKSKAKGKNNTSKDDGNKSRSRDDTPKTKRPLRNSIKADDSGSSGKSSPVTITPNPKRRRI